MLFSPLTFSLGMLLLPCFFLFPFFHPRLIEREKSEKKIQQIFFQLKYFFCYSFAVDEGWRSKVKKKNEHKIISA
jgi:hypothetical protein